MADLVIYDVAADLRNLKPFQVPESLRGHFQSRLDGVFDACFGCANNFRDTVNMIIHESLQ